MFLPEKVRVPLNERVYIYPTYDPNGAKATELQWSQHQGTAAFAYMETTDGGFRIIGRSPGIGSLSVKVDDNDNLRAKTIIEIVDPNYLPPDNVFLPSSIEISVGGHVKLQPILVPENAATSYTWSSEDSDIASVSYGTVTGVKTGTTIIKVKTGNEIQAECTVTVVNGNGKDDEEDDENAGKGTVDGYEYVDLGLSVKWATCNVGATKPEESGGYYAWGETSEKETYNWNTYLYGTYMAEVNIGSDIKGTKYDVAHEKWGSKWRMPTEKEFSELYSNCTIKKVTRNFVEGYEFTGNNGNSIFIPDAGYKHSSGFDTGLKYWSSNLSSKDTGMARCLMITLNSYHEISYTTTGFFRMSGLPIRPVTEESGTEKSIAINSTNFPDDNFRNNLLGKDYGKDGKLTESEINNINSLDLTAEGINSLKGIEFFTSLKYLYCSWNSLGSLDLSQNTELKELECVHCSLASLDLSRNTALVKLDCSTNYIKGSEMDKLINSLPYNSRSEAYKFYVIRENYDDNVCTKTQVTAAKAKGWTPYYMDDSNNWIEYIGSDAVITIDTANFPDDNFRQYLLEQDYGKDGIITEEEIKGIWLISVLDNSYQGNIKSLSGIELFTFLTDLYCYGNQISNLDVSKNTKLQWLSCGHNLLNSLDVSKNTNLKWLYCDNNQITAIDLSKNTCLELLHCSNNQLTMLDLSNNLNLTNLSCDYNKLTALNVSKNVGIKYLYCNNNQISSLDVSKNTALIILRCSNNQLEELDVSKNTVLEELDCGGNQLKLLDVSEITLMKELDCSYNQLTILDVSKNTTLNKLSCANNLLVKLDVSNTALVNCNCNDNQLIQLDLSRTPSLRIVNCYNNLLTELNLSNNTELTHLSCYHNQIKGEAMDYLISSLHNNTTNKNYTFFVVGYVDENICTTDLVATAKAKGWTPCYSWGDEYPGSDPSSINVALKNVQVKSPVYNLNGQRIDKPRKGINIIGGKKVMVK